MQSLNVVAFLSSLLALLPEAIVFGLSLHFYSKVKTIDGILLSVGSGVGLMLGVFFRLIPIIDTSLYEKFTANNLYFVTSIIGFLSSACFAIGFGMLVMQTIKRMKG